MGFTGPLENTVLWWNFTSISLIQNVSKFYRFNIMWIMMFIVEEWNENQCISYQHFYYKQFQANILLHTEFMLYRTPWPLKWLFISSPPYRYFYTANDLFNIVDTLSVTCCQQHFITGIINDTLSVVFCGWHEWISCIYSSKSNSPIFQHMQSVKFWIFDSNNLATTYKAFFSADLNSFFSLGTINFNPWNASGNTSERCSTPQLMCCGAQLCHSSSICVPWRNVRK